MNRIFRFFASERVVFCFYFVMSIVIGLVFYLQGPRRFNNLIIFRQSIFHLLGHKNLYIEYPAEYFDIFLYHPAFCILFSPFSVMPIAISLLLWMVTCSLIIFYAVKLLPLTDKQKVVFWWFLLIELATTLHSQQTNSIIAALGLFTYSYLEKDKPKWAALFPVVAFCIKGYGLIFAALFIFYPKPRKFLLYSVVWISLFSLLPLPFIGAAYLSEVYGNWFQSLTSDHAVNFGYSVMGLIRLFEGSFSESDLTKVQLLGLFLFVVTWIVNLLTGAYQLESQRLLLLAYVALWVIIFNHTSEPPTFIIAGVGVAIFYLVNRVGMPHGTNTLTIIFIFLSIVAHKDIYPATWPLGCTPSIVAKTLPSVLIWLVLQIQLFFKRETPDVAHSKSYYAPDDNK